MNSTPDDPQDHTDQPTDAQDGAEQPGSAQPAVDVEGGVEQPAEDGAGQTVDVDAEQTVDVDAGAEQPADRVEHPADERLLAAHDLARSALTEITPESSIGEPAGYTLEPDGVVSLLFENRLPGYPGWYWTVSVARVDDAEPTVLEVELMPGDNALLAPDWVPWAMRLAEYQAAQIALAEANAAAGIVELSELEALDADDDDDLDADELSDIEDLDAADYDTDGSPILHAGDVDGVDIDELSDDADDDDLDEDDDDSDDDDSDEDDDSDDDGIEDDDFDQPYDEGSREY